VDKNRGTRAAAAEQNRFVKSIDNYFGIRESYLFYAGKRKRGDPSPNANCIFRKVLAEVHKAIIGVTRTETIGLFLNSLSVPLSRCYENGDVSNAENGFQRFAGYERVLS
jgi:hypothetical protein